METTSILRAEVAAQGQLVRELKAQKKPFAAEVEKLKELKKQLDEAEKKEFQELPLFIRSKENVDNLLKRRFFVAPSFEIYGGSAGLFDLGPPGSAMKSEVELLWKKTFVHSEEDMMEITGTALTPQQVLKTSGHVDRFTDLMVTDMKTGDCHRADVLLEDWIEVLLKNKSTLSDSKIQELQRSKNLAGGMNADELQVCLSSLEVKSPEGNVISAPFPFNLMFHTKLGPKSEAHVAPVASKSELKSVSHGSACLRPETAQSIFVNFRKLLEHNKGNMPFGTAQLGNAYRNEIAPRNGLLRVREFPMAEIEYFMDPEDKKSPKFLDVSHLKVPLFAIDRQVSDSHVYKEKTLQEAIDENILQNETLAFFIGKTYEFLVNVGIQPEWLRFRQHLPTELAHYATDCWDAEIRTTFGWTECVGIADRAAYDLKCHQEETGVDLTAQRKLKEPMKVRTWRIEFNRKNLGSSFPKDQKEVVQKLEESSDSEKEAMKLHFDNGEPIELQLKNGNTLHILPDHINFSPQEKIVYHENYMPSVIEPSFGIGRVITAIWDHTYREREIEGKLSRNYFALPVGIAPWKVSVLPISVNKNFLPIIKRIKTFFLKRSLPCKVDATASVSIGKRYARTDELGVPFGITVDFQSIEDDTVTLRERDSMEQIRIPVESVLKEIELLTQGFTTWEIVAKRFPKFVEQTVKS